MIAEICQISGIKMLCSNNIVICIVLTTHVLTYLPLVIHGLPTESNIFKFISRINDNNSVYKSNFDRIRNGFSGGQFNEGKHRIKRQDIPLVETSDFDAAWKKRIVDFHNIFRRRETNAGDMLKMVSEIKVGPGVSHAPINIRAHLQQISLLPTSLPPTPSN